MDALLRRRMMFDTGSAPPPAPAPVFYDLLVFDGTAYIDTDIVPAANSSFLVALGNETLKAAQRLFALSAENSTRIGAALANTTTSTYRYFGIYYAASSAVSTAQRVAFSYATYNFWLTPNKFGFGSNGYSITKGNNAPNGGVVLGSLETHSGQAYTGTMGTFYIYGSDAQNASSASDFANYTPVYALRPCEYNGEAGLWCVETSTFYGNTAGAGTLTVRNLS